MSTSSQKVALTALIRPHMEGRVVSALHDMPEFPGFFLTAVRGQGRGKGAGGAFAASEFDLTYHRFLELHVVCRADQADAISEIIAKAAWTGHKGDGVIFATDVRSFVRIREQGRPEDQQQ